MTISITLEKLVEKVRELGIGNFFDDMDYSEIIEMGLYYYGKHIEENLDSIMEDMEIENQEITLGDSGLDEIDSESVEHGTFVLEALPRTVVYTLQEDDIDPNELIEETDYLEQDDEQSLPNRKGKLPNTTPNINTFLTHIYVVFGKISLTFARLVMYTCCRSEQW